MKIDYNSSGAIEVEMLTKSYFQDKIRKVIAVREFSINIEGGRFVTFFGPNGCGKSTVLKVLAGLEEFEHGQVLIAGQPPGKAKIGFVFQDFRESLFPWRTALDNIAFPLEARGQRKGDSQEIAKAFCEELGVKIPLDSYVYQLSGGQQQMVAIARALVYRPKVLLMDEPFSALDYQTNAAMEDLLLDIWSKLKTTILFISHEIDQAIYLAQQVILLTQSPASVAEEITIPFDDNRTQAIKNSSDFLRVKTHILKVFGREVAL
ncbi:ABC transporter ATP-binding protein [bacterium]|nr:ABC transporter ATP-binding protein [bacterium]